MDETSSLYKNLLEELECPVCTNYMAPPIRQCATGHSICQACRRKLPKCPLCQAAFTDAKNLALEALASRMQYRCMNHSSGCAAMLSLEQRESHERTCEFKGFRCAMSGCSWVGKADGILEHWSSKKAKSRTYRSSNLCHTKLVSHSYYANLVEAHDQLFWFKCKLEPSKVFWAVQFIGKGEEATRYTYEIEICKPGSTALKMLFSDYCQSVDIEHANLFKIGSCIAMSTEYLSHFVGEDQLLIYYMHVKKVDGKPKEHGESRRNFKKNLKKQRDRSQGAANYAQQFEKCS